MNDNDKKFLLFASVVVAFLAVFGLGLFDVLPDELYPQDPLFSQGAPLEDPEPNYVLHLPLIASDETIEMLSNTPVEVYNTTAWSDPDPGVIYAVGGGGRCGGCEHMSHDYNVQYVDRDMEPNVTYTIITENDWVYGTVGDGGWGLVTYNQSAGTEFVAPDGVLALDYSFGAGGGQ